MVYLLTDDSYFALGIVSLPQLRNCVVTRIDAGDIGSFTYSPQDILFLAMSDLSLTKAVLKEVTQLKLEVFVFLNVRSDFKMIHLPKRIICTKRSSGSVLNFIGKIRKNNLQTELTQSQFSVLYAFSSGMNSEQISKKFNISEKTISSHKISALKKMGLEGINNMLLMFIIDVFQKDFNITVKESENSTIQQKQLS